MTFDCIISTKDRYHTTLPLVINAIATQTVKPRNIIIYDDGECKDLREDPLYFNLLNLLHRNGIQWVITPGEHKGLSYNHQRSLTESDADYLIRLDDDVIPEYDCFEALVNAVKYNSNIGAVGGQVIDPKQTEKYSGHYSNKIEDIFHSNSLQWRLAEKNHAEITVDHLNGSCFMYNRKWALEVGYYNKLSPVCFREDTLMTYGLKRNGHDVVYCVKAKCWHMNFPKGGNRSVNYADSDEQYFKQKLNEWGVTSKEVKLIVLDNGLGDHIVFLKTLPDILAKYNNHKILLATCYPEVFETSLIEQISIAEAKTMCNIEQYSIYKWMEDRNWKDSLENAFRGMYL